jgi:hypothetical protein
MEIVQAFLGAVINILMVALVVAGLLKVFQMAGDLREMKDVLKDIKRNTAQIPPPVSAVATVASAEPARSSSPIPPTPAMTPEELVRAVHAQKFTDDNFDVLETTFPPRS